MFRRIAMIVAVAAGLAALPACPASVPPALPIDHVGSLALPHGWHETHLPGRVADLRNAFGAPNDAHVRLFTENRASHEEAVRRLADVARAAKVPSRYVVIDGWPALERTRIIAAPQAGAAEQASAGGEGTLPVRKVVAVTTAVAAGNLLVRAEGRAPEAADPGVVAEMQQIGRGLAFGQHADPAQTARDLQLLASMGNVHPPLPATAPAIARRPASKPVSKKRNPDEPGTFVEVAPKLFGEVEVASTSDGHTVVVGTQNGLAVSHDGGITFAAPALPAGVKAVNGPVPPKSVNVLDDTGGDPSVALGASGDFYYSFITSPNGSAASLGVSGCALSIAALTPAAKPEFRVLAHAVFCDGQNSDCTPDQEHIAADAGHQVKDAAGNLRDQVYMVYRALTDGITGGCPTSPNSTTARIVCSTDGGHSWTSPVDSGNGDFGRPVVDDQGFVWVVDLDDGTVEITKFSSCEHGLIQQPGFPVAVRSIGDTNCPVAGLDRCGVDSQLFGDATSLESAVAAVAPGGDHAFVSWASQDSNNTVNIHVAASIDGGHTWPDDLEAVLSDTNKPAERFLPWICTMGETAHVGWYDRGNAPEITPTRDDWTNYFRSSVTLERPSASAPFALTQGPLINVSVTNDPECQGSWQFGADNSGDFQTCTQPPPGPIAIARGAPRYGDYSGIACAPEAAHVFSVWTATAPPPGVPGQNNTLSIYADALACGEGGEPCCAPLATCKPDLNCHDKFCEPCGERGEACCTTGAACVGADLTCVDGTKTCACGDVNQPCCKSGSACLGNLNCAQDGKGKDVCQCGNLGQVCCGTGTCNASTLSCGPDGNCRSACGHSYQPCCHSAAGVVPPTHAGTVQPGFCYASEATCTKSTDTCTPGKLQQH